MAVIVECVPNFSEGRDLTIIKQITDRMADVEGVTLLDVDPGADTNRTVVTIVGDPDAVVNGAFEGIKAASELIDMTKHSGAHARQGACDVCPFVPVSEITMDECVKLAHRLGERVGTELNFPGYYYENAATSEDRRNLAVVRKGEYESLPVKIKTEEWKPDFGPAEFIPHFGAVQISAREFLIAYNVNLNTREKKKAHDIALDIREKGRAKRDENGVIVRDENRKAIKVPGTLKECKGVGWYIEEYGCAQVSMNLTNFKITNFHTAFEEIREQARKRGLRVTGSELVGLLPKEAILEAGKYYLAKQGKPVGVPEREIIHIAIRSMGLDEISEFDPDKKIIEYCMKDDTPLLRDMKIVDFVDELSTDSPAPGGGSIAALCGSISASLASMVANLTAGKKDVSEELFAQMDEIAENTQYFKDKLAVLIDEDTFAFNRVMAAMRMKKKTDEQKAARKEAMEAANKNAAMVPFQTLQTIADLVVFVLKVVENGNPASVTDAGVGGLMARSGAMGAFYNIIINLDGIEDKEFCNQLKIDAEKELDSVHVVCDMIEDKLNIALGLSEATEKE